MPEWMAAVGRLTPNGWALEQLKAIVLGETNIRLLTVHFVLLLIASGILFTVSGWRLRRIITRG